MSRLTFVAIAAMVTFLFTNALAKDCYIRHGYVMVPSPCVSESEEIPESEVLPDLIRGATTKLEPATASFDVVDFAFRLIGGMPNFAKRVKTKVGVTRMVRMDLLQGDNSGGSEGDGSGSVNCATGTLYSGYCENKDTGVADCEPSPNPSQKGICFTPDGMAHEMKPVGSSERPFAQSKKSDPQALTVGVDLLLLGEPSVLLGRSLSLGFELGLGGNTENDDRYLFSRVGLSQGLTLAKTSHNGGLELLVGGDYFYLGSEKIGGNSVSYNRDASLDRPTLHGPGWHGELRLAVGMMERGQAGFSLQAGQVWTKRLYNSSEEMGESGYKPGKMGFAQFAVTFVVD